MAYTILVVDIKYIKYRTIIFVFHDDVFLRVWMKKLGYGPWLSLDTKMYQISNIRD